jgi:hypothetical protein
MSYSKYEISVGASALHFDSQWINESALEWGMKMIYERLGTEAKSCVKMVSADFSANLFHAKHLKPSDYKKKAARCMMVTSFKAPSGVKANINLKLHCRMHLQ